ncbi:MAG: NAD-dependent succinate-semialdehyde dehydrogenase [Pseudomonadota bacterium]
MTIQTINPATGEVIKTYQEMSGNKVDQMLANGDAAFQHWKTLSFAERACLMKKVAELLCADKTNYAKIITTEMGKPITQAIAEIEKCAWICNHYGDHAEMYLAPRQVKTEMQKSFVYYEPKGLIFAIMPWNFPFWQVFRFAAPNLMAGNTAVLSHAPISTGAALAIEQIFHLAGFPAGVFQSLIINNEQAAKVIADPRVIGVTLTGSQGAGKIVGSEAAKHLKKSVLELGGSDPYLILADADIDRAATTCVTARLMVSGQVCISPKRLIVVDNVYDQFEQKVIELTRAYQAEDPLSETCNFGPMARADLRETIAKQVNDSMAKGAVCVYGGKSINRPGFYYQPTILKNIQAGMPAYEQELFGPVICLIRAKDEQEAIAIANDNAYGLGAAVFTRDEKKGERIAVQELRAGVCAVNTFVASDPRMPFGGTKQSGYGRECSAEGIYEFMNIKSVSIA